MTTTPSFLLDNTPNIGVYRFGSPFDSPSGYLPGKICTKHFAGPDASDRARWRAIAFHGEGTITVQVYVDGVFIIEQVVTMTEAPDQSRVLNLPRGTSGYYLRYDFTLERGHVRLAEIYYETMNAGVN